MGTAPEFADAIARLWEEGFIILPRGPFGPDSEILKDREERSRFIDLLMLLRFSRDRNGIPRGSCEASARFLARRWQISPSTAHKQLRKWQQNLLIKSVLQHDDRGPRTPARIEVTLYDYWTREARELARVFRRTREDANRRGKLDGVRTRETALPATREPSNTMSNTARRIITAMYGDPANARANARSSTRNPERDSERETAHRATANREPANALPNKEKYRLLREGGDAPHTGKRRTDNRLLLDRAIEAFDLEPLP